ncbi:hypothetical protein [Aquimarina pacifica]|uniref:hypothetical protein n=1 Tax=Aquimarina pacifica TaxID=1296415 RepID=UPI00046F5179|nr:hypothetical protein [Aquimarina pacifica]
MKMLFLLTSLISLLLVTACNQMNAEAVVEPTKKSIVEHIEQTKPKKDLPDGFKDYWYEGKAEISSYYLEQARYGEIRKGTAVLIYVTEDFLPKKQVKADNQNTRNIPVLKLNATKNFNTGIYPYAIMQSTFYPVADNQHALKVSSSMQEWCGHVYSQLNNREHFEIVSHSYFENEADTKFTLDKAFLENEIWTKIRISPEELPLGTIEIIPSFEFCRLKHKEIKAYKAKASLQKNDSTTTYILEYPELKRSISITFTTSFPYEIEEWSETFTSGFGNSAKEMTTTATKTKQIKSPYWRKNSNQDEVLRKELGL